MFTTSCWLLLVAVLATALALVVRRLRQEESRARTHAENAAQLRARYQGVEDVEVERQRVLREIVQDRSRAQAEADQLIVNARRLARESEEHRRRADAETATLNIEVSALRSHIATLKQELVALDEVANLRSFGYYKPHYEFATSVQWFEAKVDEVRERQKRMIKNKTAAVCHIQWTVDGSVQKGQKQINQTLKLILRAFNGECDAAFAKVKYNNVVVMEERIRKAWQAINGLVEVQQCNIASDYLHLKLEELQLVHEHQERLQAEKEEQRRIREQMRDEEIAQRQLEKARQDAEKEEQRYAAALTKARREVEEAAGAKQLKLQNQIAELERRLQEAHDNKERAIARAQLTRSGHLYVISNIGSFGEHVYKVGMTRRLDPHERIRELGDASVPFEFDVHAVIYSEDAPALENQLHRAFHNRRVNRVNERKEFFRVSIDEIAEVVRAHRGDIEVTRLAEAQDYRKTLALIEQERALQIIADVQHSAFFDAEVSLPAPVLPAAAPATPIPTVASLPNDNMLPA